MKIKSIRAKEKSPPLCDMEIEVWMSSNDVARFLSTTPNAVRIMVCRGILPNYKLRGRLRFRKIDCVNLLKKQGA